MSAWTLAAEVALLDDAFARSASERGLRARSLVAWTASLEAGEATCDGDAPPVAVRLAVARGRWQRQVAAGRASVAGLRGAAAGYRSRYRASQAALEARAAAAWRCS